MAFFHGPTSWSNFRGLISYEIQLTKNLDPLTKCKPNVNQEEWPFTAKVNVLIYFSHMSKKGTLEEHTVHTQMNHVVIKDLKLIRVGPNRNECR